MAIKIYWSTDRDGKPWTHEEFMVVFNLYMKMPFGRMSQTNKDVQNLARLMHRKPGSIAYRLVNFAACDKDLQARGIVGMVAGAKQCQPYWDEYFKDRETFLFETEKILAKFESRSVEELHRDDLFDIQDLKGEDRIRAVKTRVNQNLFRQRVLSNYDFKCAITGINEPSLLIASHIIPWADNKDERMNPANAICLSPLYDKAFDKGFIGFDKDYHLILSDTIKQYRKEPFYEKHFGCLENQKLIFPEKCYKPNPDFLDYHMKQVFKG